MSNADEVPPFNPDDPGDIIADMFRKQVTELVIEADKVTLYREMNPQEQLQCFIAGALTGVVGVAFASVKSDGFDAMAEYIAACLPFARQQAEGVHGPNGETLINLHDDAKGPQ